MNQLHSHDYTENIPPLMLRRFGNSTLPGSLRSSGSLDQVVVTEVIIFPFAINMYLVGDTSRPCEDAFLLQTPSDLTTRRWIQLFLRCLPNGDFIFPSPLPQILTEILLAHLFIKSVTYICMNSIDLYMILWVITQYPDFVAKIFPPFSVGRSSSLTSLFFQHAKHQTDPD